MMNFGFVHPHKGKHVFNTLKQGSIITDKLFIISEHDSPTCQPIPRWKLILMWHKIPSPSKEE